MRRDRSPIERQAIAQRMTPGAGGGRTPLVAPVAAPLVKLETVPPSNGYVPLAPWGVEGDAPLHGGDWHGVYTDDAAAAAPSGPVFEFGIEDGGTGFKNTGLSLLPDATDTAKFGQWVLSDDGTGTLEMWPGDLDGYLRIESGGGISHLIVGVEGVSTGGLIDLRTSTTQGYIDIKNSDSDPSAPSDNFGRLFVRLNGSAKTEFCVRFNGGAVQVIATEP